MIAQKLPHVAAPTVAVIDDDQDVLDLVRTMLELEGHQVMTFHSSLTALEGLGTKSPNLVILDIKMPEIDGMELLRHIRESAQETTVIIITAFATVETAVAAMKAGGYDYITKPIDYDALMLAVHRAMERHESRHPADLELGKSAAAALDRLLPRRPGHDQLGEQ